MITLEPPAGLSAREIAAYRLGLLNFMLRAAELNELVNPPEGVYATAFENEREYQLYQLGD